MPDHSFVSEARRVATGLAQQAGFGTDAAGKVAIVATELATNLVKHANGGEEIVREIGDDAVRGVEILALDNGPGIVDVIRSLEDGYSTSGSLGFGLGAVLRLSESFEIYTHPEHGSAIRTRFWLDRAAAKSRHRMEVEGVSVPLATETACGDAWAVRHSVDGCTILVVDGLGHGVLAEEAAHQAVACFMAGDCREPVETLEHLHRELRSTRGAAGAVVRLDLGAGEVRFAGLGNISARIISSEVRNLVSLNGTLGHHVRTIRAFSYPWLTGALLVLHSDGIGTHWTLPSYPGLLGKTPSLIAGVLYRDLQRGRDDSTVVVAREAQN